MNKKIVNVAEAEIGTTEYPINSNKTKYGKWFGLDGVSWCGTFVSWVYDKAGYPLGTIGFKKGFAGCGTAINHFTKSKEIVDSPVMGDIVFFDWNVDGRFDHTGIFIRFLDSAHFETIEGNTGLNNQSNGGEVMRRTRSIFAGVVFVHPKVLDVIPV